MGATWKIFGICFLLVLEGGSYAFCREMEVVHLSAPCVEIPAPERCLVIEREGPMTQEVVAYRMPGSGIRVAFERPPGAEKKQKLEYSGLALERDWVAEVFSKPRGMSDSRWNRITIAVKKSVIQRIRDIRFLWGVAFPTVVQIPGDPWGSVSIEIPRKLRGPALRQVLRDAVRYLLDQELRGAQNTELRKMLFAQDLLSTTQLDCTAVESQMGRRSCEAGAHLQWVKIMARFSEYVGASAMYGSIRVRIGQVEVSSPEKYFEQEGQQSFDSNAKLVCDPPGTNCISLDENAREGQWEECNDLGECWRGKYQDGLRTGWWRSCLSTGVCAEGQYQDGEKVGFWKEECFENGVCAQGEYADGKKVGRWKEYCYASGVCSEGRYQNDAKVGVWKAKCFENGVCSSGEYQGMEVGVWKICHADGACEGVDFGY